MYRRGSIAGFFGRNLSLRVLVCLLAFGLPLATQPVLAQKSVYVLAAQAAVSSVKIKSSEGVGMGVVLGDGYLIATCAHVVGNDNVVMIDSERGKFEGTVYAVNTDQDLAIIKTTKCLRSFFLNAQDSGMPIGTFTAQAGMDHRWTEPTINTGYLKAFFVDSNPNLMISSSPRQGHSGGPVMDESGRLIGITRGFAESDGVMGTEVIPVSKILELIRRTQ